MFYHRMSTNKMLKLDIKQTEYMYTVSMFRYVDSGTKGETAHIICVCKDFDTAQNLLQQYILSKNKQEIDPEKNENTTYIEQKYGFFKSTTYSEIIFNKHYILELEYFDTKNYETRVQMVISKCKIF